jgi:RNA polymerase sigma-70 factor, ECF subfamily
MSAPSPQLRIGFGERFFAGFSLRADEPSRSPMNPASEPSPTLDPQRGVDADVVRRIASGDRQALAEMYDRYSRPLCATAYRILNDATEAEDIVHDVFVTLWTKASDFDSTRGSVFSWAVALTRNRAIDRLRSRRRRSELLDASAPSDLGYEPSGEQADSTEEVSLREKAQLVRAAVGELAPEQRTALELAFFSGLTQQEIAARLKEPLGTVKARIRRGLLKLRDRVARRL